MTKPQDEGVERTKGKRTPLPGGAGHTKGRGLMGMEEEMDQDIGPLLPREVVFLPGQIVDAFTARNWGTSNKIVPVGTAKTKKGQSRTRLVRKQPRVPKNQ